MNTHTPVDWPTRTPEPHLVVIVALAKINSKAAARYVEQIEAAARRRGGVRTCAALGLP